MPNHCLPPLSRRAAVTALCSFVLALKGARAQVATLLTMGFYLPVLRDVPRRDVEVSLRFWLEELGRSVNLNLAPVQFFDDFERLKRAADAGQVNFMVGSAVGFVQQFADHELADGLTGYRAVHEDLLLVARRDAGIRTISHLVGKRLALLDSDELTDIHLETLLMKTWAVLDWGRVGPISRETRSGKLVNRLFFNTADAAFIYRNGYETAAALNPKIGQRLEVLDAFTFKTRSPFLGLFTARTALADREGFIQGALTVNETPRGRQVLQIYQADRMGRTAVADLQPYRELLAVHRALKAAGPKKKAKP